MNLQTEKLELAQLLLATNDKSIIEKVRALFKRSATATPDELPPDVIKGIEKSRLQAKEGRLKPFEQVLKDLKGK